MPSHSQFSLRHRGEGYTGDHWPEHVTHSRVVKPASELTLTASVLEEETDDDTRLRVKAAVRSAMSTVPGSRHRGRDPMAFSTTELKDVSPFKEEVDEKLKGLLEGGPPRKRKRSKRKCRKWACCVIL